jgi:hypothetical protein
MAPKKSVTDGLKTRVKRLVAENQSLVKAKSAIKRAVSKDAAQTLAIGGVAAGAGTIGGYKLQEYLNNSDLPEMAKAVGGIPTGTLIGAAIALYGAFKMKGQAQALVAGAGGGCAGGAYLQGPPA